MHLNEEVHWDRDLIEWLFANRIKDEGDEGAERRLMMIETIME